MIRPLLFGLVVVLTLLGCSTEDRVTAPAEAAAELPDERERFLKAIRQRAMRMAIEAEFREREAAAASGERGRQLRAEAIEARARADEAVAEAAAFTGWTVEQYWQRAREVADASQLPAPRHGV